MRARETGLKICTCNSLATSESGDLHHNSAPIENSNVLLETVVLYLLAVNSPQVLCELANKVRFLLFDVVHDSIVGIADLNP